MRSSIIKLDKKNFKKKGERKSFFNSLDPSSILENGRKNETTWNSASYFLHEVTWW